MNCQDGGAVGITDNSNVLNWWMIAGPEIARVIEELKIPTRRTMEEWTCITMTKQQVYKHVLQKKKIALLVSLIEELGKPFQRGEPRLACS